MLTVKRALVLIGALFVLMPLAALFAQVDDVESAVTAQAFRIVNVRSGPSTRYPVIAQLDEGQVVTVVGRSDSESNWLLIDLEDEDGWVAYFTVTVVGDPSDLEVVEPLTYAVPALAVLSPAMTPEALADTPEPTAIAGTESAAETPTTLFNTNLRAEPEYTSNILLTIPFNTAVEPDGRTDNSDWLHLTYEGQTGWVIASLIDMGANKVLQLPVIQP